MMWAVDCRLRRKNWSYIDSATNFMWELGADGIPPYGGCSNLSYLNCTLRQVRRHAYILSQHVWQLHECCVHTSSYDWYINIEVYVEEKWNTPTFKKKKNLFDKTTEDFQSTSTYNVLIVGVTVKSGSEPLNLLSDRSLHGNLPPYFYYILISRVQSSERSNN